MLTTAVVECQLFAYFLLMKERLKIINLRINNLRRACENESIDLYRSNLDSFATDECHNESVDRINDNKSKIFFISELVRSEKQIRTDNASRIVEIDNVRIGSKSNFAVKLKSIAITLIAKLKSAVFITENLDAQFKSSALKNNDEFVKQICNMQLVYTKLIQIADLISKAYGVQIILIISIQFLTLTTLLYFTTMKIIR